MTFTTPVVSPLVVMPLTAARFWSVLSAAPTAATVPTVTPSVSVYLKNLPAPVLLAAIVVRALALFKVTSLSLTTFRLSPASVVTPFCVMVPPVLFS